MGKKIIKCSQCNEEFENGYDYRMHWETHYNDYLKHGIEYCREKSNKIKYNISNGNKEDK